MSSHSKQNQRQSKHRAPKYEAYRMNQTTSRNKVKRMLRVLKKNPGDKDARSALIRHGKLIGKDYANAKI